MSFRTVLLDPDNDQKNRRTIFRLPEGIYPSNFKLLNVGCTTPDATPRNYNELAGILGIVKQISLLDGAVVLDSIDKANIWNAFKSFNKGNNNNRDLQKNLRKNNLGFENENETFKIIPYYSPTQAEQTEDDTGKMWVDLSDMFPFLRQIKYIDSAMFPNFRIVLEYESDKEDWLVGVTNVGQTTEPLVVCTEINDPEFRSSVWREFKGMNYVSYEVDTVRLSSNTPTAADPQKKQSETFRLNGFDGKILSRTVVSKNALATANGRASGKYGKLGSEAQNSEVFQLRVNGSQLFPRSGVVDNNERLGLLNDVWGVLNSVPSTNSVPFYDSVNYVEDSDERVGRLDYFGANIGYKIEDLQLDYERKGAFDSTLATQDLGRYNQSLDINMFGEVMKRLVWDGKKYIIAYM